jgi:hypothetical protein
VEANVPNSRGDGADEDRDPSDPRDHADGGTDRSGPSALGTLAIVAGVSFGALAIILVLCWFGIFLGPF